VDAGTDELRRAHDALAELYAQRLADAVHRVPADRAVLGPFAALIRDAVRSPRRGRRGAGPGLPRRAAGLTGPGAAGASGMPPAAAELVEA
jgi:hypothetical protein